MAKMDEPTQAFLSDIHANHVAVKLAFEERVNWVLGTSAILVGLTIGHAGKGLGYDVIFFSSVLSFLIGLILFEPPAFLFRQSHHQESIMYYKSFQHLSREEFAKRLANATKDKDAFFLQYAGELQNMVGRHIRFKASMIKLPVYILFFGVIGGLVLILAL